MLSLTGPPKNFHSRLMSKCPRIDLIDCIYIFFFLTSKYFNAAIVFHQPERVYLVPAWLPVDVVYCGPMWVKKCSELSISAVSEEATLHLHFLLSSHSTVLILRPLKPSPILVPPLPPFLTLCCSWFYRCCSHCLATESINLC